MVTVCEMFQWGGGGGGIKQHSSSGTTLDMKGSTSGQNNEVGKSSGHLSSRLDQEPHWKEKTLQRKKKKKKSENSCFFPRLLCRLALIKTAIDGSISCTPHNLPSGGGHGGVTMLIKITKKKLTP